MSVGFMMPEEPIIGCVDGKDVDGNPCWPKPDPMPWIGLVVAAAIVFWVFK